LGKAAFYDHFTLQKHTGFPTAVLSSNNPNINPTDLSDYISKQSITLPYSPVDEQRKRPVPINLLSITHKLHNEWQLDHKTFRE
jgi:hypothetical protein